MHEASPTATCTAPSSAADDVAAHAARTARGRGRGHCRRACAAPACATSRRVPRRRHRRSAVERAGARVEPDRGRRCAPGRAARRRATSGLTWIAAGTLPRRAAHPPVGDEGDAEALASAARRAAASACAAPGMPFARGPWKRTTATKSRSSCPARERGEQRLLRIEDDAPAPRRSSGRPGTADTLITARPQLPTEQLQAAARR